MLQPPPPRRVCGSLGPAFCPAPLKHYKSSTNWCKVVSHIGMHMWRTFCDWIGSYAIPLRWLYAGCMHVQSAAVGIWHEHSCVSFGVDPPTPQPKEGSLGGWVGGQAGGFGRSAGAPTSPPPPSPSLLWGGGGGDLAGPPPLCDIPSHCCSFTGPWTVTRSSLRILRRVSTFCRPLRPVLLLVSFPRSRSPVVGVLGLC